MLSVRTSSSSSRRISSSLCRIVSRRGRRSSAAADQRLSKWLETDWRWSVLVDDAHVLRQLSMALPWSRINVCAATLCYAARGHYSSLRLRGHLSALVHSLMTDSFVPRSTLTDSGQFFGLSAVHLPEPTRQWYRDKGISRDEISNSRTSSGGIVVGARSFGNLGGGEQ